MKKLITLVATAAIALMFVPTAGAMPMRASGVADLKLPNVSFTNLETTSHDLTVHAGDKVRFIASMVNRGPDAAIHAVMETSSAAYSVAQPSVQCMANGYSWIDPQISQKECGAANVPPGTKIKMMKVVTRLYEVDPVEFYFCVNLGDFPTQTDTTSQNNCKQVQITVIP